MTPTPPALAYRRAATQQASVVGLVIALYDTLAEDLRKAAAAMDRKHFDDRSRYLKHGFSVLTQMDALIDAERGGRTAVNLRHFYGFLREEMLRAQFTQDTAVLLRLCSHLLEVREAWQEVDTRTAVASASVLENAEVSSEDRVALDCQA